MNDQLKIDVKAEAEKAAQLFLENVYTKEDLASHMLSVINAKSNEGLRHKEQLERFLKEVVEMRDLQKYFHRHKKKLTEAKAKEIDIDHMIMHILSRGYSIERFNKEQPKQVSIFEEG